MKKSDKEFLDNYDVNKYERPSVTTDVVIFTVENNLLKVLLYNRNEQPFEGLLSLPGGFLDLNKTLLNNAIGVLERKTGLQDMYLEQLFTFGDIDRDPRTRVIDVVYFALVPIDLLREKLNDESYLLNVKDVIDSNYILAFDHKTIIKHAVKRIQGKLSYTTIGFNLINNYEAFTIGEVQKIYEAILDKPLVRMNFKRDYIKKYIDSGLIEEARGTSNRYSKRPSKLYRIKHNRIK